MTPREKGRQLILKFTEVHNDDTLKFHVPIKIARKFALISINEVIESYKRLLEASDIEIKDEIVYLEQVKYLLEN